MNETSETLRLAARAMRDQHGPEHQRHEMWAAMADLMEKTAKLVDLDVPALEQTALSVADAYLAAPSPSEPR